MYVHLHYTIVCYAVTLYVPQSTKLATNHLYIHSLSLFYYPIAASPITPQQARQSGDDTDSGCGQTPAGSDGRDGLPGPPGPQGLADTATDH